MQKFSSIFSQLLQLFPGYADAIVMKSHINLGLEPSITSSTLAARSACQEGESDLALRLVE
jgi:hypothetical protein